MRITKIGHCCLVVEDQGLRIMTDPGVWSSAQNEQRGIGAVLITHEHPDHFHLDSLKQVLANNPDAKVVTNRSVGALLSKEGIPFQVIEHGGKALLGELSVEGCGDKHAVIYEEFGSVQNTGFLIGDKLFYPGDALYDPGKPVEVLALPVAGPWVKISESVEYALRLKPKKAFPVHDGLLKHYSGHHTVPQAFLPKAGISFDVLELLKGYEY